MSEQVKFYRGNYEEFETHKNPEEGNSGEIIFVNDAIDNENGDKNIGSIYQDEYIVGTTRADELRLTNNLQVLDGPLANETEDNWPEDWYENGQRIIPKGKSMEDILKGLFMKELWGNATWNTPIWSPYINKPTINSTYGNTLEIGTVVKFSYSTDDQVYGNVRTCTLNANYGYFETQNGDWNEGGTQVCEQSKDGLVLGTLDTKLLWNGKEITTSENLEIQSGDNVFKVEVSGLTASVVGFDPKTVYPSTNTKKCIYSPTSLNSSTPNSKELSNESQVKISGKYKYFIGYYSDSTFTDKVYTSDGIRKTDVIKTDWMNGTNINYTITIPTGTKGMYIAIPVGIDDDGSTLKVKQVNTNAYVNSEMITNSRTVSINCGGTHTKNYKVFTWSFPQGTSGEEPFEITSF